jgi:hypothetical protein
VASQSWRGLAVWRVTGSRVLLGVSAVRLRQVKVDVAWYSRPSVRHITIGSRFSPVGIETAVPGGTLVINAVNSSGVPLAGAQVRVVNASTN